MAPAPKRPRAAAEFEVRPGRNKDDQLAVVVAALLDDQKSEALDSLKTVFAGVISELRAWDDEAKARRILNGEEQNDTEEPRKHVTSISLVCIFSDLSRFEIWRCESHDSNIQRRQASIAPEAYGSRALRGERSYVVMSR